MAQVGMLDRFVEVMEAVGEGEREEMIRRYEAEMQKELGEVYVAASRTAIEKAVREREKGNEMDRMRKIELSREGVRRRYFRENSGPEDVLDCGIHSGRKFEDVYLDHKSYVKWVLELGQPHMWSLRCFRYFLKRLMDLERTLKGGRDQEQRMREERLEMSESLVEEMALEERNVVEDFERVRWADLEDEELSPRYEQMAEKEEITNRSETLTETQATTDGHDNNNETWQGGQQEQENTSRAADDGDDEARQGGRQEQEDTRQAKDDDNDETRQGDQQQQEEERGEHESDELIWTEEEYDPNRYAYLYAPNLCPECQEPLFDGCDCVDVDWTADSERREKEYKDRLKQRRDGERRREGEQQKEMNDGGMQQEKQQQQGKGEGMQSLEELIRIVQFRMQQEEKQEQMNGEDEATWESETYRKKRESEQEIKLGNRERKRNGKGKGDSK